MTIKLNGYEWKAEIVEQIKEKYLVKRFLTGDNAGFDYQLVNEWNIIRG